MTPWDKSSVLIFHVSLHVKDHFECPDYAGVLIFKLTVAVISTCMFELANYTGTQN